MSKKKTKKLAIIIVILLIFLILVYVAGLIYFSSNFLPKTFLNNADVSLNSAQKSLGIINSGKNMDKIEIVNDLSESHKVESISLEEINYENKINIEDITSVIKKQNYNLWFLELLNEKTNTIASEVSYDEELLEKIINNLPNIKNDENTVLPKNAYVKIDESDFYVIEEVLGNEIDKKKLKEEVKKTISNFEKSVSIKKTECYIKPEITKEDDVIKNAKIKLDNIKLMELTYNFGPGKQEVLTSKQFFAWISFDKEANIEISKDEATKHIKSLATKYDTVRKNRQFTTSHDTVITTGGGIYGYQTNVEKSAEHLIEKMYETKSTSIDLVYKTEGLKRDTKVNDDIGNTYIEIDLTTQQMWYYENGELHTLTDIVTGLPFDGRATPVGLFSVWSKERKRYLRGEGYKFWVEYWIPVNWGGIGIHDSSWQSVYGGEHYKTRGIGSHGCINTPFKNVASIYNDLKINTPVIIYNS